MDPFWNELPEPLQPLTTEEIINNFNSDTNAWVEFVSALGE